MTFWDFCSPIYDFAQKRNVNYEKWNEIMIECVPPNTSVLELAGGTGEISIRVAKKAKYVVCTDLSEKMLKVARKKAETIGNIKNIKFKKANIYDLKFKDNQFDIVIASQVLHLLDNPQRAIDEMKRVSKDKIIVPICLIKNVKGFAKFQIKLWKLLGFNPRYDFDRESYIAFLKNHGLKIKNSIVIDGSMPIIVVVCESSEPSRK